MIKDRKKSTPMLCARIMCVVLLLWAFSFAGCAGVPFDITYSVDQDGFETSSETVQYDGSGGSKVVSEYGVDPLEASGFQEQLDFQNYELDPYGR